MKGSPYMDIWTKLNNERWMFLLKALVYSSLGKVEVREVDKPKITNATDALVKVTLTTICGSDVHLVDGHIPTTPGYVLGHEYVGIVEEVGPQVKNISPGDRVIGPAAPFCGQCENCRKQNIAQCLNGGIHGAGKEFGGVSGTHSQYIVVPHADVGLTKIPPTLKDEEVLFLGDIFSTGYFAIEKCQLVAGDTVVIFGAGPVGLCAVQAAKLFSASKIILIDIDQNRLEIGKRLGATHVIQAQQKDVLKEIFEITGGKGANGAVEAAGLELTLNQALRCVGIGGTVTLVGIFPKDVTIPIHEIFMKNIRIEMGLSYLGNIDRFVKLVENKQIDLIPMITHRMDLSEGEKAFDLFKNRKDNVVKIAIKP